MKTTSFMMRFHALMLVGGALAIGTACDYDGSFLFADIEDIDGILHLTCDGAPDSPPCPAGQDPDYFTPIAAESYEELLEGIVYGEVGATGSSELGGVTLNFEGTGRDVCIWVDPEVAFWNQSVAEDNGAGEPFTYPDNVYDDGDLDLFVGLSVYYTGSPGEEIGDFNVSYTDDLGNLVPIELTACSRLGWQGLDGAQGGRASSEFCTINNSDQGISYTVLFRNYSTPLDDDRTSFGFIVFDGDCGDLTDLTLTGGSLAGQECVIPFESINPANSKKDQGPWFGASAAKGLMWERYDRFEEAFCANDLPKFCKREAEQKLEDNFQCTWQEVDSDESRCFCGDPRDTPAGGA